MVNYKNIKKDDLVKIIDDLSKQNEELAELNWNMDNEIDKLNDQNKDYELLEENERLKNKIDILENLDSFDLYKENQKLKDENDILKKTIKIIK